MNLQRVLLVCIALAVIVLGGCGGGGDDSNGGPSGGDSGIGGSGGGSGGGGAGGGGSGTGGTPSGIGAAGGTVTGPSGAQVVIPAGALAQSTAIEVTQSSSGAPPLPIGMTAVGSMFAFTPHGTTFATPATITVPFDPAQVASGGTPLLYKTNPTQTGWELVSGATISGNLITATVSGFSHVIAVNPLIAHPERPPIRDWWFFGVQSNDVEAAFGVDDLEDVVNGIASETVDFGRLGLGPPGHDDTASGEIFSNATGLTYWVEAEAPTGDVSVPTDVIGSITKLQQYHFFRKREENARLRFVISEAWVDAIDNNGTKPVYSRCPWAQETGIPSLCVDEVFGEVDISFALSNLEMHPDGVHRSLRRAYQGILRLWGWQNNWLYDFTTNGAYRYIWSISSSEDVEEIVPTIPIFNEDQFDYSIENGAAPNTNASMRLKEPITVEIDLTDLEVGDWFMVDTIAIATTNNRRARESFVAARLRDPAKTSGIDWQFDGLDIMLPVDVVGHTPIETSCDIEATGRSGTIQFSAASYALPEFTKNSSRTILVTRTGGSEGPALVRVSTSDDTAVAGTHYQPVSHLIKFGDGDTTPRRVRVPTINDNEFGGPRRFNVTLSAVNNCANLGAPSTAVVTLLDDETPPPGTYSVGGTVTGLSGTGLVLEEIITGSRVTPNADGPFAFNYAFPDASAYNVRILTQPTNPIQTCSLSFASGNIASANVSNVQVSCASSQAPGALDTSFGASGRVTAGLSGGARALAMQPDGKILGVSRNRLARYLDDGHVDTSFGANGEADVTFNGTGDEMQSVAIQPDGRILVAGYARNGTTNLGNFNIDWALARYNADGTLDTTFGERGIVFAGSNLGVDRAYVVLVQPDGRIVLAGHMVNAGGTESDFAVARFNSDGSPDTSFGINGVATINSSLRDQAYAAALQADGSIVVVGEVGDDAADPSDVGVARFTASGIPDSSFGTSGFVRIDYPGGDRADEATDVAIQPDGRIVIAGHILSGDTLDFLVARLNADGSKDLSFGAGGYTITPFGAGQDTASAVAIHPDGRIVVAGTVSSIAVSDIGIARYLSTGALDTQFGPGGTLSVDFFGGSDGAEALVLQPDGKIVAAGSARNGSNVGVGIVRVAP